LVKLLGEIINDPNWRLISLDNNKKYDIRGITKRIFSSKRTQFTLYIAMILWLAVITQIVVNYVFRKDFQITEAFVKTDMEEMKSSLEIISEYNGEFLSETDKKDMIHKIADSIGLNIDKDITILKEGAHSEYIFAKQARLAETEIKIISMEQEVDEYARMKHYIIVRMSILQSIQSIEKYKDIIVDTIDELGTLNKQITMRFDGNYDGNRSNDEKKQIAEFLIDQLHGEIALDYAEGDHYTVYAYTGLIDEYILSLGSKVNIQVAITYNEQTDKTVVTLATPILNDSW